MAKSSVGKTAATPAAPVLFDEAIEQPKAPAAASLAVLQQEVAACTQCSGACQPAERKRCSASGIRRRGFASWARRLGRTKIGLGEPFVGRAGQLLTKIIEACRLKREDVYILNMIKCRPPGNRNPLPNELANCRGFLGAAIRSDSARVHLLPGGRGLAEPAQYDGRRSANCGASSTPIAASRSCVRSIRPICCGIRRPRRMPGRI